MRVISGVPTAISAGLSTEVSRYSHKVFVEQLGWDLSTQNGMEQDQFDRSDTVYVVAQDEEENISGCARLLPTIRPYLLSGVFPQLLNGLVPPSSLDIWELSRFAAVDFNNQTFSALNQFYSPAAIELLRESMVCAAKHGAKHIITVSPIGI